MKLSKDQNLSLSHPEFVRHGWSKYSIYFVKDVALFCQRISEHQGVGSLQSILKFVSGREFRNDIIPSMLIFFFLFFCFCFSQSSEALDFFFYMEASLKLEANSSTPLTASERDKI